MDDHVTNLDPQLGKAHGHHTPRVKPCFARHRGKMLRDGRLHWEKAADKHWPWQPGP